MLCIFLFVFESRQIQTTKRKRVNTLICAKKLPKRLIFYRAYKKNEEHKYSRSEFYYPEDLMQRLNHASIDCWQSVFLSKFQQDLGVVRREY